MSTPVLCHELNAENVIDCSDKAPWAIRNTPTCLCHFFTFRLTYCHPKLIKFFTLQPCLGEITSYTELICSRKYAQKRSWPITFSIKIIRKWKLAHVVSHKGIMMAIFMEKCTDNVVYWIRVLFGLDLSHRLESGRGSVRWTLNMPPSEQTLWDSDKSFNSGCYCVSGFCRTGLYTASVILAEGLRSARTYKLAAGASINKQNYEGTVQQGFLSCCHQGN